MTVKKVWKSATAFQFFVGDQIDCVYLDVIYKLSHIYWMWDHQYDWLCDRGVSRSPIDGGAETFRVLLQTKTRSSSQRDDHIFRTRFGRSVEKKI
jgi:hypothetical protein